MSTRSWFGRGEGEATGCSHEHKEVIFSSVRTVRVSPDPFTQELDIHSPRISDEPMDAILFAPEVVCADCGETLDMPVFRTDEGMETLSKTPRELEKRALVDRDRAEVVGFLAALALSMLRDRYSRGTDSVFSDIFADILVADPIIAAFFSDISSTVPTRALASDVAAEIKAYLDNVPAG